MGFFPNCDLKFSLEKLLLTKIIPLLLIIYWENAAYCDLQMLFTFSFFKKLSVALYTFFFPQQ